MHIKPIAKTICFLIVFILLNKNSSAQYWYYPYVYSDVHSKSLFSSGYVNYNDGIFSKQVFKYREAVSLNFSGYLISRNYLYIRSSIAATRAELKENIKLKNYLYQPYDNFYLTAMSFALGYEISLIKTVKASAYSGLLFNEYGIAKSNGNKNYYNKTGFLVGADIKWLVELKKESQLSFLLYLNNSLNYSRLKEEHEKFSNFYYSYEIGFGFIRKCEPRPGKRNGKKVYRSKRGKYERRKRRRQK